MFLILSCLGNRLNRGAWWATVHGVTKESDKTQRLSNNNNKIETGPRRVLWIWG